MPVTEIGDPRLQALFGANDPRDASVKPVVRLPRKGLPPWALGFFAVAFGLVLFVVLNGRRTAAQVETAPAVSAPAAFEAPPPLYIPVTPAPVVLPAPMIQQSPAPQVGNQPAVAPIIRTVAPPATYVPQPLPQMAPPFAGPPARVSSGAPLVIDSSGAATGLGAAMPGTGPSLGQSMQPTGRVRASVFANRSTTVPQGYVIPAVLETGFDSTQAGFARAVVSRDVRGFDGENILIPRGSKLIGEYKSDVAAGQKRAVITWTRLIRPDGMTIAMDSPAVDPVGRGGVPASVNNHFFQRLTGALLQSTLSLGTSLAGRSTGSVYVLPGATAAVPQLGGNADIAPTLSVAPGKSISVFVAHDLDFSGAEAVR